MKVLLFVIWAIVAGVLIGFLLAGLIFGVWGMNSYWGL